MIIPFNVNHKTTKAAFDWAVGAGIMTENPDDFNYTGNFMFLGEQPKGLKFKNLESGAIFWIERTRWILCERN